MGGVSIPSRDVRRRPFKRRTNKKRRPAKEIESADRPNRARRVHFRRSVRIWPNGSHFCTPRAATVSMWENYVLRSRDYTDRVFEFLFALRDPHTSGLESIRTRNTSFSDPTRANVEHRRQTRRGRTMDASRVPLTPRRDRTGDDIHPETTRSRGRARVGARRRRVW